MEEQTAIKGTEEQLPTDTGSEARLRQTLGWVAGNIIVVVAVIIFYILAKRGIEERAWLVVTQEQFAAVIGLPAAAIASLFVVLVLRISSGPMEVEISGLKFKGGAAPIVFWLICFLAIVSAIKLLWISG